MVPLELGKRYYIIAHAYWHFAGEVTAITPRGVSLKNVCQVHSCQRGWSQFLKDGFGTDTTYDVWPDGAARYMEMMRKSLEAIARTKGENHANL